MKNSLYAILFSLLFSFACDDKDENYEPVAACGVNDVLSDLPWLAAKKEALSKGDLSEYSYIKQAIYEEQPVFFVGYCCPHCNWILTLYDCAGNIVEYDFMNYELSEQNVIWQPKNSECTFTNNG